MNVFRLSLTALLGLFLQAAFNPDRRQGIGFGAALAPWARLHGDDAERRAFLERHVKAFNTNPAMAAPILGAVARLETRAAAGDAVAAKRVLQLKQGTEGPFAAAGDRLVWNGVRPLAGYLGLAAVFWAGGWGVVLFLALYNLVHLGLRLGGVFWGFARGEQVHMLLRGRWLRRAQAVLPWLVLAAAVLAAASAWSPGTAGGPAVLALALLVLGAATRHVRALHGARFPVGVILTGYLAALVFQG